MESILKQKKKEEENRNTRGSQKQSKSYKEQVSAFENPGSISKSALDSNSTLISETQWWGSEGREWEAEVSATRWAQFCGSKERCDGEESWEVKENMQRRQWGEGGAGVGRSVERWEFERWRVEKREGKTKSHKGDWYPSLRREKIQLELSKCRERKVKTVLFLSQLSVT